MLLNVAHCSWSLFINVCLCLWAQCHVKSMSSFMVSLSLSFQHCLASSHLYVHMSMYTLMYTLSMCIIMVCISGLWQWSRLKSQDDLVRLFQPFVFMLIWEKAGLNIECCYQSILTQCLLLMEWLKILLSMCCAVICFLSFLLCFLIYRISAFQFNQSIRPQSTVTTEESFFRIRKVFISRQVFTCKEFALVCCAAKKK